MRKIWLILLFIPIVSHAQILRLPERPENSVSGNAFVQKIKDLSLSEREEAAFHEITTGNVPGFLRNLVPLSFSESIDGKVYHATFYVLPDYLAIGCDTNFFLMPMTPVMAQRITGVTGTILPTRKIADIIWRFATVRMTPEPIPPSPEMTTVPVMFQHHELVWQQRQTFLPSHLLGELTAGHKKDVVISNKIHGNPPPKRVVIYGWHYPDGKPIQPMYHGHVQTWADYSHGIRLVQDEFILNGKPAKISEILKHETLHRLFSDEGVILNPGY
jgi:hypothetical protein